MTTFAIGDLQGCREQFEALLDKIQFNPDKDKLWFTGDLVNRGPDSLGTLRLLYSLRDQVVTVLGNHDLHMLAVARCPELANRKDTFNDVLNAPDAETLLSWLESQPLLHENDNYVITHAGIYPFWTLNEARQLVREIEGVLATENKYTYYRSMYGNEPEKWDEGLQGQDRLRFITNCFTRMRFFDENHNLKMDYKATIQAAPDDYIPWYKLCQDLWEDKTLLIGHWAALLSREPRDNLKCLDTGCIWGNTLSAYALDDKVWYQVPGNK